MGRNAIHEDGDEATDGAGRRAVRDGGRRRGGIARLWAWVSARLRGRTCSICGRPLQTATELERGRCDDAYECTQTWRHTLGW